jgi:hypothetical protein
VRTDSIIIIIIITPGKPRRRWEDNIKMDLQEVGGGFWGLDGVGSG